MTTFARSLFLPLLVVGASAHAGDLGKADCRIAPLYPPPVDDAVSWSGGCKDGFADGKGVLEWRTQTAGNRRLEGTLVQGEVTGEAILTYDAGKYLGSVGRGMPHGLGAHLAQDGSTYEGQWQGGRRHGVGKATFALGGSYEGEWRGGQMHGQGKIVYNGGRTYAGEFVNGRALGAAPRSSGDAERFGLKEEHPRTGTNVLRDRASGFAPMDASWQELTPPQQSLVRNAYPALDDGDEPPYPLKGTRAFFDDVAKLYRRFHDYRGDALVYVTVGPDGKPTSASTFGVPHQEFARYLAMVTMIQRFKPALCAGTPCEMIYPMKFRFKVN
ncbi:MORN repeat-containing protein [Massilia sp. IC2-476]|uniref:MORN repeat-containing protein n=1 Tax=Massilia sp. IC2-476 TaxID=2887199 RepID=UPI001D0FF8FA|nr:hypothetical protein [Massilia sp. IC2-476]MCC2972815.1 hypothetical protein [Massilia sp. IC2-476]